MSGNGNGSGCGSGGCGGSGHSSGSGGCGGHGSSSGGCGSHGSGGGCGGHGSGGCGNHSAPPLLSLVNAVVSMHGVALFTNTKGLEIKVKEVVFADAALELPQDGEMYAQVQTPGYKAYLKSDNLEVLYHLTDSEMRQNPDPSKY